MRVSNSMNYDQVKSNIQKNRSEMSELQNQAASMKRITKPSDDPVGTARMLSIRTSKVGTEQYLKNLEMARTFLNYSDQAMGELTDALSKAKELAIGQANDAGSNAETRMAVATQIDQMFQDLVNIGNRKFGDRFIFGGYKTTHSPFDMDGNYHGDNGTIQLEIGRDVFASINVPGNKLFIGTDDPLTHIPEDRRGSTTPNYPPAPSTVPKPEQQKSFEMRGPASVDSSAKSKEAAEKDESPSNHGENIFNVFKALSAGLRANDTTAIQDTLDRLDDSINQVILLRAQVGAREASLDNTSEALSKSKIDDSAQLSTIEDADAFSLFTDISKNENTLKATLQTSGKMIQPSLLDFLR